MPSDQQPTIVARVAPSSPARRGRLPSALRGGRAVARRRRGHRCRRRSTRPHRRAGAAARRAASSSSRAAATGGPAVGIGCLGAGSQHRPVHRRRRQRPPRADPRCPGADRGRARRFRARLALRGEREPGSLAPAQIVAGHLAGLLIRLLYGVRFTDMSPFRAIRRDVLDRLGMCETTFGWNLEMQMRAAASRAACGRLPSASAVARAGSPRCRAIGAMASGPRGCWLARLSASPGN